MYPSNKWFGHNNFSAVPCSTGYAEEHKGAQAIPLQLQEVSQQLGCAALATGVPPELAPAEISCTHACTVTMPATGIAAGVPLELRANMHLNKSDVVRARLLRWDFYPQPGGLSVWENSLGVELHKQGFPIFFLEWNIIEISFFPQTALFFTE